MSTNTARKAGEQPKRRACDECRGRKLACSKEIDGCARCKREGIKCVYSPQKPMGRPRKRAHVKIDATENTETNAQKDKPNVVTAETAPALPALPANITPIPPFNPDDFALPEFDPTLAMDLDFSFLDMSNADLNFIDIIDPSTQFPPNQYLPTDPLPQHLNPLPPIEPINKTPVSEPPGQFFAFGTDLGQIDFNSSVCQQPPTSQAPEISQEDVTEIFSIPNNIPTIPDDCSVPSLSPGGSSSSSSSSPSADPHSNDPPTCSCLTSLYLAMESVKVLPKSISRAMRITRAASRTAHDSILCKVCSDVPLFNPDNPGTLAKPPMVSLQSLMMLGALLPSLSNAYMRILTMVDQEAAAADRERRKIVFTLSEYGGLWGTLAELEPYQCGAAEKLEGRVMEAGLWRLTVRALLKIDVYGVPDVECRDVRMLGLKDIIGMMEERSRRRHRLMDELVERGPTCLRIIDIAKRSMEELIIP
ncbi:uncharacterized protein QC761_109670 [Podospora bellae-mahoneyi]|uniref:Zn(2)-C6 fungal-type domain-containing protein n=1 Tax=Podospora bellae-mahoneyi TaxID=2093777 RepID=A0ABR0FWR7_9PEZI|nr:hypothetical protein QC761_109670 [Podospora bellae-mahoneyi]